MDQMKVGSYIAELRKKQEMTQKELAQRLNVSDKLISKWETGRSIPDAEYLMDLCEILHTSVNELLCGEKLSETEFSEKMEETLMSLMKDNEVQRKSRIGQTILGIVLIAISFVFMLITTQWGISGMNHLVTCFIDFPSFLFDALLCAGAVLLAGKKGKEEIMQFLVQILTPVGVLTSLVSVVIALFLLNSPEQLGPSMAVCALSLFYCILAKFILLIFLGKKNKLN